MSMNLLYQTEMQAYEYRTLAFVTRKEIDQMGDAEARKRPYRNKKHEQPYTWYLKHYTEMADMLDGKVKELLESLPFWQRWYLIVRRIVRRERRKVRTVVGGAQ